MKGKQRCKILKEIRQRIADENGIEYITSECRHKGDCRGTCPKCESEVRYLERELERRRRLGKNVAVAGVAMGIALSSIGCNDAVFSATAGDLQAPPVTEKKTPGTETITVDGEMMPPETEIETLTGDIYIPPEEGDLPVPGEVPDEEIEATAGILPPPEEEELELMGEPVMSEEEEFVELAGDIPLYYLPSKPEGLEGEDADYINRVLIGRSISDITEVWGDADMTQKDKGIASYFTEAHDILIKYDTENGIVSDVATIKK